MAQLYANNAFSTLAGGIGTSDTSIFIAPGTGSRFPVVAAPDVCYCTLENASGVVEVVQVTAHTAGSTTLTVVRAQQGTSASAYSIGDLFELRPTALEATNWEAMLTNRALKGGETFTGTHNFLGAVIQAALQAMGDSSSAPATTQWVAREFARLASPALTGTPTAPTAALGTNTNQIATMAALAAAAFSTALPGQPGGATLYQLSSTAGVASWTIPAVTVIPVNLFTYQQLGGF